MITIKHRFTETTLCEFDVETVKAAVVKAVSSGANLRCADLYGANLYGANLEGADLYGEKLTQTPIVVTGLTYWCLISDSYMRLGCKRFTHAEWDKFSDSEIADMDSKATAFWSAWKSPLLAMCKAHSEAAQKGEVK